jgi:hypothetical protein
MSKHDKDLIVACVVVGLAVFFLISSAAMPRRGDVIESPGIFPGLMSGVLLIFGISYLIRSIMRGGGLRLAQFGRAVLPFFKSRENRPILLGFLFPGIYVFIGIPLIGFYISSVLFMGVMFYLYVKRWRRWFFLPVSIGITVALYLIFNQLFMLQIW